MQEILPGVFHWSAVHPNTGQPAHSYSIGTTLVDPILPEDGIGALPVVAERIVLTSRHHWRSTDRIVASRGGIPVLVHKAGQPTLTEAGYAVRSYAAGDELAPGLTAVAFGAISPDDAAVHAAVEGGALGFADGLRRDADGELAFMPDRLLGENPDLVREKLRTGLRAMLDLTFDHLLFAHGEPRIGGGHAALSRFVAPAAA